MTHTKLTHLSKAINNTWHQEKCNVTSASDKSSSPVVADTGATSHFMEISTDINDMIHCDIPITNVKEVKTGIKVLLPNEQTMQSTHEGTLDIQTLPLEARKAYIFPRLASGSLLSIGQLCDAGCSALFVKTKLYIFHKGKIIMQGSREKGKL